MSTGSEQTRRLAGMSQWEPDAAPRELLELSRRLDDVADLARFRHQAVERCIDALEARLSPAAGQGEQSPGVVQALADLERMGFKRVGQPAPPPQGDVTAEDVLDVARALGDAAGPGVNKARRDQRRSTRWDNEPTMSPGVNPDDPSGTKADATPPGPGKEGAIDALLVPFAHRFREPEHRDLKQGILDLLRTERERAKGEGDELERCENVARDLKDELRQHAACMSRGEFYAAIRLLEVFAPADPLVTRVQTALGNLCEQIHPGVNTIGQDMAEEVDRVEKMKQAPTAQPPPAPDAEVERVEVSITRDGKTATGFAHVPKGTKHVCGLHGYDPSRDPECPRCAAQREAGKRAEAHIDAALRAASGTGASTPPGPGKEGEIGPDWYPPGVRSSSKQSWDGLTNIDEKPYDLPRSGVAWRDEQWRAAIRTERERARARERYLEDEIKHAQARASRAEQQIAEAADAMTRIEAAATKAGMDNAYRGSLDERVCDRFDDLAQAIRDAEKQLAAVTGDRAVEAGAKAIRDDLNSQEEWSHYLVASKRCLQAAVAEAKKA